MEKHIHFTLTQAKYSANNSSPSQHQFCLSGNWLTFTDETQTNQMLITQVSLVLVFFQLQRKFKLLWTVTKPLLSS